jgi:MFS transporter, SP family, solute carrier family 2 (myo-inositol transporter), member 13
MSQSLTEGKVGYNRFLLLVAGLGGLLYGVDVGIISGALPYLEATSGFNASQLSFIVAAVLLGSVISTLFAGVLADWMGRKRLMALSGIMFVISIPMIALSQAYSTLVIGRLLQGTSAGLIGVVIPLYLAECLSASSRGKGTGIFQWMLTFGFVVAGSITLYFSDRLDLVTKLGDAAQIFAFKDHAWRNTFWVSLPPGIVFVIGSLIVSESPRWLFRRGKKEAAYAALLRSRSEEQATAELQEMEATAAAESAKSSRGEKVKESLLRRKYVIPFVLACIILACNQLTGVNSIIGYNTTILLQGGLSDVRAHWGSLVFSIVNFLMTMVAVALVDRKGRKFLLSLGTAGIILSLTCTGILFRKTEQKQVDAKDAVQKLVATDQTLTLPFDQKMADSLLTSKGEAGAAISGQPSSMVIIYSYGDFSDASGAAISNDVAAKPISVKRNLPGSKVEAFFKSPSADLEAAKTAPLKIDAALITPVPSQKNGWLVAITLYLFMAFFAVGPGVCVWLALSELMPTRIRSNGMSFALLINQAVSTTIAAIFLPTVGKHGYSFMFFMFAAFTVIYFVTAAFFLPETKGKTLEEIEEFFEGDKKHSELAAAK